MPTHRMHLKGPWIVRRLDRDEPAVSIVMPRSWHECFRDECGRAEFRRRFNQPTNLEAHEHVWLVFDGIGGPADVRFNQQPLGDISSEQSSAEFEITSQLRLHNEVVVNLSVSPTTTDAEPRGLWGPVALEIRFDDQRTPTKEFAPAFRAV